MSLPKPKESDATPCHQARASSDHEPSGVELLMCLAFIVAAIAALGFLWSGFAGNMVQWLAPLVISARPH